MNVPSIVDNDSHGSIQEKRKSRARNLCQYCVMKFEHKETLKRHAKNAHGDKGNHISNLNPFGGF
jgi:hypothetical protein